MLVSELIIKLQRFNPSARVEVASQSGYAVSDVEYIEQFIALDGVLSVRLTDWDGRVKEEEILERVACASSNDSRRAGCEDG